MPKLNSENMRMVKLRLLLLSMISVLFTNHVVGAPLTVSIDAESNYNFVFPEMPEPKPTIINNRVERIERKLFGIFSLNPPANGNWEFELYATRLWVNTVQQDFKRIEEKEIWSRTTPVWFSPNLESFSIWQLQTTSYPSATLFIEKNPKNESYIHVFIRRH